MASMALMIVGTPLYGLGMASAAASPVASHCNVAAAGRGLGRGHVKPAACDAKPGDTKPAAPHRSGKPGRPPRPARPQGAPPGSSRHPVHPGGPGQSKPNPGGPVKPITAPSGKKVRRHGKHLPKLPTISVLPIVVVGDALGSSGGGSPGGGTGPFPPAVTLAAATGTPDQPVGPIPATDVVAFTKAGPVAGPAAPTPTAGAVAVAERASARRDASRSSGIVAAGGLSEPTSLAGGPWHGVSLQAATRLTVPVLFAAVVGLFVLLQALIDRRDPKVARAPERGDDETVGFQ